MCAAGRRAGRRGGWRLTRSHLGMPGRDDPGPPSTRHRQRRDRLELLRRPVDCPNHRGPVAARARRASPPAPDDWRLPPRLARPRCAHRVRQEPTEPGSGRSVPSRRGNPPRASRPSDPSVPATGAVTVISAPPAGTISPPTLLLLVMVRFSATPVSMPRRFCASAVKRQRREGRLWNGGRDFCRGWRRRRWRRVAPARSHGDRRHQARHPPAADDSLRPSGPGLAAKPSGTLDARLGASLVGRDFLFAHARLEQPAGVLEDEEIGALACGE